MSDNPKLIQISIGAIAKMLKFDMSYPGKETAGLLIGREEDGVVLVTDVRLGEQVGNAVHVAVSEAELTQAAIEISQRDDGHVIVGWIHTHPSLSAFLSSTDINTQSLYQAFMPNSIAIVMDGVKFAQTRNIQDLDLKCFRVTNRSAVDQRYMFIDTVEFGLNTFLHSDIEMQINTVPNETRYYIPMPSKTKLRKLRQSLESADLGPQDIQAVTAWLDLVDAIESGDSMEVPVDVERLITMMNQSIGEIQNDVAIIRSEARRKNDARTLFFMFLGAVIEIAGFALLL